MRRAVPEWAVREMMRLKGFRSVSDLHHYAAHRLNLLPAGCFECFYEEGSREIVFEFVRWL